MKRHFEIVDNGPGYCVSIDRKKWIAGPMTDTADKLEIFEELLAWFQADNTLTVKLDARS